MELLELTVYIIYVFFSVKDFSYIIKLVTKNFLNLLNYSTAACIHQEGAENKNIVPIVAYSNADTQKLIIFKENRDKAGIYRWVNLSNGKTYVGSSVNLTRRFKSYYSVYYLENEGKKNNSLIYRALLKNGYSNFKLEILEYCESETLIEREQFYLDLIKPEYNILKYAGSLKEFKHSAATIERMREIRLNSNRIRTEEEKLKHINSLLKGVQTIVIDIETNEIESFISGREAAKFIGINQSGLAKYLSKQNFYLGRGYLVHKSDITFDEVIKSEAYQKALGKLKSLEKSESELKD